MEPMNPHHKITFFVNEQPVPTEKPELTGLEILELSHNTPTDQFKLERIEGDGRRIPIPLDELVKIHEHERFAALFQGPTPLS